MACLNMMNNEQQALCSSMAPRISFSHDFVETKHEFTSSSSSNYRESSPASSDFEFSVVSNFAVSVNPADELFSQGKLLPLKKMTLRDELMNDDDFEEVSALKSKVSSRWKERLGLRRTHIGAKKIDGGLERIDETEVKGTN